MTKENGRSDSARSKTSSISRRDFIKLGAGAAAIAAGTVGLSGKIPLTMLNRKYEAPMTLNHDSSEPVVAMVRGDTVTVMNAQGSVKFNDRVLAGLISERVRSGD